MLRRNRNHDSCEKSATGTENTGIRRIPAGICNLGCCYWSSLPPSQTYWNATTGLEEHYCTNNADPWRHDAIIQAGRRVSSDDLHPFKICSFAQNAMKSPCLQLLGFSTSWDVILKHLSHKKSVRHVGVNGELTPDTAFKQMQSKVWSKLATFHQWSRLIQRTQK